MNKKEALRLLEKYLNGTASVEEKALIDKWYNAFDLAESIPEANSSGIKEELYRKIVSGLSSREASEAGTIVPIYRRMIFKVAAAIFFVLLSVGAFFLLNNKESRHLAGIQKNQTLQNDIAPGGNKAILTLSNGSTIILDSIQNGLISQQGNSKVIKLDDGKLAYRKESSATATVQYNTISTPRGGQYQLELADGSHVWLNAASSITFPTSFTGKERSVVITGEAYFEVTHNEKMPFYVKVNNTVVQVLGTHFNINAYDDEGVSKTTLLQGSVKVSKGKESVLIQPGEQVQVSQLSDEMVIKKNVDLAVVMAWKNGRFAFSDADIQTVMRQLARWYNFNIEFKGEIKDKFHIEMTRNTNLSNVFKILEGTGGVHFEIGQNKVIVMP